MQAIDLQTAVIFWNWVFGIFGVLFFAGILATFFQD